MMSFSKAALVFAGALLFCSGFSASSYADQTTPTLPGPIDGPAPIYLNKTAALEDRVNDLYGRLTQDEKISLLSGHNYSTSPIPRLGVPGMSFVDAGEGVRGGDSNTMGPATEFPCGVMMASSWDPATVSKAAAAIGEETLNKGVGSQVLLGPDVNIHRSPLNGRDGESFTEDPYLNAQLAIAYIQGIQSSGASGCIKHYVANNEEGDRNSVDVQVSERALREIYFPAFKAAVQDGHAWTAMAAYNKINGFYATANSYLITQVLKKEWGFDGLMMSDWGAVHETIGAVNAGNDLEMPGQEWYKPQQLADALAAGQITQAQIDDSAKRVIRTLIRVGVLDGPAHVPDPSLVNSQAHADAAYQSEAAGIILLKNSKHILPLDFTKIKTIALIGPAASTGIQGSADGSPSVTPVHQSTILEGLTAAVGPNITVNYSPGVILPPSRPVPVDKSLLAGGIWNAEYYSSMDLSGSPVSTGQVDVAGIGRGASNVTFPDGSVPHSAKWTGSITPAISGNYQLDEYTGNPFKLIVDGVAVIDVSVPGGGGNFVHNVTMPFNAGQTYKFEIDLTEQVSTPVRGRFGWILPGQNKISDAVAAAKAADIAVVVVTTHGQDGEARDRPTFSLPGDQDALIQAVAAANKHTIVILNSGSAVDMHLWLKKIPGLVDIGFPGQEGGRAAADVLIGKINPSGKTTDTFGQKREDYPDFGNFPGGKDGKVNYAEGIYVGYRHFDKKNIKVNFPFGYGLSYTSFKYSNLKLSTNSFDATGNITATFDVTNTGQVAGSEVAELYVSDLQPKVDRPIRELKGFKKVALLPSETQKVTLTISPQDLAYYDTDSHQWLAQPGAYDIEIGASSRDIKLAKQVTLESVYTAKP